METLQSTAVHGFDAVDLEYLVKRGVDPELAAREGFKSVTEAEVHAMTKNELVVGGGLCMAYRAPLPKPWEPGVRPYVRIQLHERDANGGRKTDVPSGPVPLYFTTTAAKPSTDPIFITESPVKALALASAGFPCSVGLGGVDGGFFVAGSQRTQMQPHLEPIFTSGRTVYIAFDAGRATNPRVAMAEAKIARKLLDRGCKVRLVEIPLGDDGKDQGPDDYVAAKGKQAFAELVKNARNADPIQHAHDVRDDADRARQLRSDLPFLASIQAGGGIALDGASKALKAFFKRKELDDAYKMHPAHRAPAPGGNAKAAWERDLITDKHGTIKPVAANFVSILENDPAWHSTIAFNELKNDVEFKLVPSAPQFMAMKHKAGDAWIDSDDVALAAWFQTERGIVGAKPNQMREVVVLAARRRSFCPLRDYFTSLAWDGTPRLDDWLSSYCGAASTEYTRLAGRFWLLSAVARAFEPGCQADYALVLEGPQGAGKSSALRILGGDFFTDDLRDVGGVEAAKQLLGKSICELSELAAITRKELETIKSFVTRRVDNFRPSYGRTAMDFPRRAVLAGTVNPVTGQGYLKDPTGDRRWWPVAVGTVRLADLQRDRDQLWAEVVAKYKSGERWHPTPEEKVRLFMPEQQQRREIDAFEEPLAIWLSKAVGENGHVTMQQVLSDGLQIPLERHGAVINRVRKILHGLGWISRNVRVKGQQFKAWTRGPDADPHDATPDVAVVDNSHVFN